MPRPPRLAADAPAPVGGDTPGGPPAPGVNLASVAVNNSCAAFADWMLQSGPFGQYSATPPPIRPDGYPAWVDDSTGRPKHEVGFSRRARAGTILVRAQGKGIYLLQGQCLDQAGGPWITCAFDGSGNAVRVPIVRDMQGEGDGMTGMLYASDRADPIHNISIISEGSVGTFTAEYLAHLRPFRVLRHMDWLNTNHATAREFADLLDPPGFCLALKGSVPLRYICELHNVTGADCWVNIPHTLGRDGRRKLARYLDANLAPGVRLYIEYSNEVWNGYFDAAKWLRAQYDAAPADAHGPSYEYWITKFDIEATSDFVDALSPARPRTVVVARQCAAPYTLDQALLAYKDAGRPVGMAAVAPYMGIAQVDIDAAAVKWKADQAGALDDLFAGYAGSATGVIPQVVACKAVADKYGVPLGFYECGQGAESPYNNDSTAPLIAANSDPRIYGIYRKFLDGLPPGIALAAWYNDCGPWLVYGCWPHRCSTTEPVEAAYKYRAISEGQVGPPIPPPFAMPGEITTMTYDDLKAAPARTARARADADAAAASARASLDAALGALDEAEKADAAASAAWVEAVRSAPGGIVLDPPAIYRLAPGGQSVERLTPPGIGDAFPATAPTAPADPVASPN